MQKSGVKSQRSEKAEPAVFIHLQPTANELRQAFMEQVEAGTIKHLPEWLRTLPGWMSYLNPKPKAPRAIAFCPVVIEVEGRYPAVIYLTNWRECGKSVQVHFAAHAQYRPKTVFWAAKMALRMILNSKEVDLLEVCCEGNNQVAEKMARAMGFSEVARVGGCVYSLKTNKGDIYGRTKSTKASSAGESGCSCHSGECRGSGCR
jgi:hypothetical protein